MSRGSNGSSKASSSSSLYGTASLSLYDCFPARCSNIRDVVDIDDMLNLRSSEDASDRLDVEDSSFKSCVSSSRGDMVD